MVFTRKLRSISTRFGKFIADHNPDAADRTTEEILSAIEALVAFPHQGYRRPNLTSRPLRFKLVGNYVIAYAPERKPLWVVAVFHGRRSPRVIAAMLREDLPVTIFGRKARID